MRDYIRSKLTDLCLFCLVKVNRYKDRYLSQRLFEIAENYNNWPGNDNYNHGVRRNDIDYYGLPSCCIHTLVGLFGKKVENDIIPCNECSNKMILKNGKYRRL